MYTHLQLSKQYFTIKSAAANIILRENEISLHIHIHKYMNVEIKQIDKNLIHVTFKFFLTLIPVPECKGLGFNGFCGHLVDP